MQIISNQERPSNEEEDAELDIRCREPPAWMTEDKAMSCRKLGKGRE